VPGTLTQGAAWTTLQQGRIPPVPRPPLPPFPPNAIDPSTHYDQLLPWTPPQTRDFLRANAWSVTIRGLPFVYGGSNEQPERCIQWFLPRWSRDWQQRILTAVAQRSYTHFVTIVSDVVNDQPNLSLGQFAEMLRFIRGSVPYVQVGLASKVYQPRDMSVDQWKAYVDPILDAVLPVCDEVVPAWEWDSFNIPGGTDSPSVAVPKYIGQRAHAAGVSCWMHFLPHVTWWGAAGTDCPDRFAYWSALGADVDGLQYQQIPTNAAGTSVLPISEAQARLVDTLSQFGRQGNQHKLRHFEDTASLGFTQDRPDEDDSDERGYLACCTIDNVAGTDARIWGYGNGGRRPDGSSL
jgi:hypothetical protein